MELNKVALTLWNKKESEIEINHGRTGGRSMMMAHKYLKTGVSKSFKSGVNSFFIGH